MNLTDNDIRLRALEAEDLDTLYRWENDTTHWGSGTNITPFSRKQLWEYINNYDGDIYAARQLRLIITKAASGRPSAKMADNKDGGEGSSVRASMGTPIGMIDLYDFDATNRRAAVGILIDADERGKGYGAKALQLLEQYAFERLGIHQLYALVGVENAQSIALFKGRRFKTSGCLRSWLRDGNSYTDVCIFQKIFGNTLSE